MKISAVWDTGATKTSINRGMDIMQLGDFPLSNADANTRFSFVLPPLPMSFGLAGEADRLNGESDNKH
jgi:hypothetical protein